MIVSLDLPFHVQNLDEGDYVMYRKEGNIYSQRFYFRKKLSILITQSFIKLIVFEVSKVSSNLKCSYPEIYPYMSKI